LIIVVTAKQHHHDGVIVAVTQALIYYGVVLSTFYNAFVRLVHDKNGAPQWSPQS
jgi:hypothetical protein